MKGFGTAKPQRQTPTPNPNAKPQRQTPTPNPNANTKPPSGDFP
ncbi:hypothetical protein ABN584_08350 [Gloeocapsa sp. BRSZ]